jgi:hypothetical protein
VGTSRLISLEAAGHAIPEIPKVAVVDCLAKPLELAISGGILLQKCKPFGAHE